jgi:hypothetical protein
MEETGNSLAELRSRSNQPLAINRPAPLPILHFCLDIAFIFTLCEFFQNELDILNWTLVLGLEVLARNVGPHERFALRIHIKLDIVGFCKRIMEF